ncbi:MAG: AAA family ATPase [Methylacidiphilales bacterium]|nr:AAA family ATPase [Candidatus Methylacidiphilales bacterium]
MRPAVTFTSVRFDNFKALEDYSVSLQRTNLLVGPNNAGKSTIIGAFRALEIALRRARSRKPEWVPGPKGYTHGYSINTDSLPISIANVHTDYNDEDSTVTFRISNGNKLHLYFPKDGGCSLIPETTGKPFKDTLAFKALYPISLAMVPILGPVENEERILEKDTVSNDLATHRASRHFRNFWYHFPEGFDSFSELVRTTWPGMDIKRPERPELFADRLIMFCTENRISRELYWAGYGFQIWCQLLTHISRSVESTLLVIDEPEIYLHPDLQRQLMSILKGRGPDILLATHSPELLSEADPSDILIIDKTANSAKRLHDVQGVQTALDKIGSLQNLTLTQLARNRRLLFIEGPSDFRLLRRIAAKMGLTDLARGVALTAVPSGGFSTWKELCHFASTLHKAFGKPFHIGALFDRDYWPQEMLDEIQEEAKKHLDLILFHSSKEVENYLLIPEVLDRLMAKLQIEKAETRKGDEVKIEKSASILERLSEQLRIDTQAQLVSKKLEHCSKDSRDKATIMQETVNWFEKQWSKMETRMQVVSGKKLLQAFRTFIQTQYGLTFTEAKIIDECAVTELSAEVTAIVTKLDAFCKTQ